MKRFTKKIETVASVSDAFLEELHNKSETLYIKKNEILIPRGSIPDSGFFIASGSLCARLLIENRDYKTVWFYFDELFHAIAIMESYHFGLPSDIEIVAIQDSNLLKLSFADVRRWVDIYPEFGKFRREDMKNHISIVSQIRRHMIALKKKDFVEFLASNYPIILERISNRMVADFIGITPEWLSKLKSRRNKLEKKEKISETTS